MATDLTHIFSWQFARRLLRILVPLVVILAAILWLLHQAQVNALHTLNRSNGRHAIELAIQTMRTELDILRGDTRYLAKLTSLQRWLDSGKSSAHQRLARDLLSFSQHRGLYDQIRFIDSRGQERIRINWDRGHPTIAPQDQLQDKSSRYYVQQTLPLKQGEIYTSPFDLNIENGMIEQPLKPMIRLATPVFDDSGQLRGMIILNYLGQRLLDRLAEIQSRDGPRLWLLNGDGYWLLGPEQDMQWAFMYPDRPDVQFERDYPEAWTSILAGPPRAQVSHESGLFTYARISPAHPSSGNLPGEKWILVAHTATATLNAYLAQRTRSLLGAFFVLLLLLVVVSGVITHKDCLRRRSESRIRDSEARFRGLLDSAPDAVIIVDDQGLITLVNAQTEQWFGYDRDELVDRPIEVLIPKRFRDAHESHRQDYIHSPTIRPMGMNLDLAGRRKDGSEFPVEVSLSPLHTEQGLLVTSIIRDITTRKQAEEAQHQVQARYQDLVNNLPVGVYRKTTEGNGQFIEVNPAMLTMFEADNMEELLTHPVGELYVDPEQRREYYRQIFEQGAVNNVELRLRTLRGREFDASVTAAMKQQDSDGRIYIDAVVEDIGDRKRSERRIQQLNESLRSRSTELETINRELEAFSYSVSHDLRAPLRAIDGFSRTLLNDYDKALDERGRDRLGRVRAAAQRMAVLIDELLRLSRVSRTEISREGVDLSQIARQVMEEFHQDDPQRAVNLKLNPNLRTRADPRLLRVVMDNLLGNAWKFTKGCDEALIEIGNNLNGNEEHVFFVRDNGAGFDMAFADKLFGAFQRLHDNHEFPGTGIGLATVQRVIHKHGGRIWAESEVGRGATFYFTLNDDTEAAVHGQNYSAG